jgi:hypothetical protein
MDAVPIGSAIQDPPRRSPESSRLESRCRRQRRVRSLPAVPGMEPGFERPGPRTPGPSLARPVRRASGAAACVSSARMLRQRPPACIPNDPHHESVEVIRCSAGRAVLLDLPLLQAFQDRASRVVPERVLTFTCEESPESAWTQRMRMADRRRILHQQGRFASSDPPRKFLERSGGPPPVRGVGAAPSRAGGPVPSISAAPPCPCACQSMGGTRRAEPHRPDCRALGRPRPARRGGGAGSPILRPSLSGPSRGAPASFWAGGDPCPLETIGSQVNIGRERARPIEQIALERLWIKKSVEEDPTGCGWQLARTLEGTCGAPARTES